MKKIEWTTYLNGLSLKGKKFFPIAGCFSFVWHGTGRLHTTQAVHHPREKHKSENTFHILISSAALNFNLRFQPTLLKIPLNIFFTMEFWPHVIMPPYNLYHEECPKLIRNFRLARIALTYNNEGSILLAVLRRKRCSRQYVIFNDPKRTLMAWGYVICIHIWKASFSKKTRVSTLIKFMPSPKQQYFYNIDLRAKYPVPCYSLETYLGYWLSLIRN